MGFIALRHFCSCCKNSYKHFYVSTVYMIARALCCIHKGKMVRHCEIIAFFIYLLYAS